MWLEPGIHRRAPGPSLRTTVLGYKDNL
uniref:Uncharacterized protein n=1 Tax=Anguilla anguilla TaxID=7936 RepID=A0A0E9SQL1_ANGAN